MSNKPAEAVHEIPVGEIIQGIVVDHNAVGSPSSPQHPMHENNMTMFTGTFDQQQQQQRMGSSDPFDQIIMSNTNNNNNNNAIDNRNNAMLMMMMAQQQQQQNNHHRVIFPMVPAAAAYADTVHLHQDGAGAEDNNGAVASFWQTSLFQCESDLHGTLEGLCCTRCQLARQYNFLSNGIKEIDIGAFVVSLLADVFFAPAGIWALNYQARRLVRHRYQIVGSDAEDCAVALCCTPCATCQQYREMSVRNEWPKGCCIDQPFALSRPNPNNNAMA